MARAQRILIDATMAKGGGGYTYLVNMVPRLLRSAPDRRIRLLLRSRRLAEALSTSAAHPNLEIDLLPEIGVRDRLRFTYLDAVKIARRWKTEVYFSVGESVPARGPFARIASFRNPQVFTSIPEALPHAHRWRRRLLRAVCEVSARTAHQIMFVSSDSAAWIGDELRLPPERRAVVHHGIDPSPWRAVDAEPSPFEAPFILTVGSVYPHKNFVRLVDGFVQMARTKPVPHHLVIVGDVQDAVCHQALVDARSRAGDQLARRIHILGEVPYEEVRRYYRHADLFVFPSYLETFGHPLLEAMASDVPVVASDLGVFREVAGEAALYADPFDPAAFAAAMSEVLLGFGVREALVKRGREIVRHFSWDRSVRGLLGLLDRAYRIRLGDKEILRAPASQTYRAEHHLPLPIRSHH